MSSCGKGDLSAVAKAEILNPEISIVARGQAIHCAETRDGLRDKKGERNYGVPGSETVEDKSTVIPKLGRSIRFSQEYRAEAEKTTRRDDWMEVGLTHSRDRAKDQSGKWTRLKGLAEELGDN